MRNSFSKGTLKKLETLLMLLGYTVRYEKGQFKSGYCIVKNRNIVVLNRFYETKQRVITLNTVLSTIPISDLTILDEKSKQYLASLRPELFDTQMNLSLAS